jgi:UDP-sugar transporter A1/2/3
VIIVQLGQMPAASASSDSVEATVSLGRYAVGVCAVLAACCSSGFASVFFERMLKSNVKREGGGVVSAPPSLWIRNVQVCVACDTPTVMC